MVKQDFQIRSGEILYDSEVRVDRLLTLADFLEKGELGHKRWVMYSYNGYNSWYNSDGWVKKEGRGMIFDPSQVELRDYYDSKGVGTEGNAIGELPFAFPKDWEFKPCRSWHKLLYIPCLKNDLPDIEARVQEEVCSFFGIDLPTYFHLFCEGLQEIEKYGGKELEDDALPKDIAFNIREFVKITLPNVYYEA
jgi:hypothetical protein